MRIPNAPFPGFSPQEKMADKIEALQEQVARVPGVSLPFDGPVFNEFVIRLERPAREFKAFARQRGVLAGIELDGFAGCGEGDLLVAVTEKRTAAEIDLLAGLLAEFLSGKGTSK